MMRALDFAPLYRTVIGFDHFAPLLNTAIQKNPNHTSYPPYNIESVNDDNYRIAMAVAGFTSEEIDIVVEKNTLTVTGQQAGNENHQYLYQGIAARDFKHQFKLAEYIRVNKAELENGLLHIDLTREVPEAMKPKKITINSTETSH